MAMKKNPLKAALARGTVQVGTRINMIQTPALLTLLAVPHNAYRSVCAELRGEAGQS